MIEIFDVEYNDVVDAFEEYEDGTMDQYDSFIAVIDDDIDKILGYCRFIEMEDYISVLFIYVSPEFRGNGYAENMLEDLAEQGPLELIPANEKLGEFYESLGFYYTGRGCVMRRD